MIFAIIMGLMLIALGILIKSYNDDVTICTKKHLLKFDSEDLGTGCIVFGAVLAASFALGKLAFISPSTM